MGDKADRCSGAGKVTLATGRIAPRTFGVPVSDFDSEVSVLAMGNGLPTGLGFPALFMPAKRPATLSVEGNTAALPFYKRAA